MRILVSLLLAVLVTAAHAEDALAPGGTLRVAFLKTNPAQAIRNVGTGEYHGVAIDLAQALALKQKLSVDLKPLDNPAQVIEAVAKGEADIGFVAPNAERVGPVSFTKTYMLVQQTFLVKADSAIQVVADIDKPGNRIGANRGDSIAFYLKQNLKNAALVENPDFTLLEAKDALMAGKIQAFGANRQRLTQAARGSAEFRLLPDNLYGVPQAVAVANGKPEVLKSLDGFLGEAKSSGLLKQAIEKSGVVGISVAE